MKYICIFLIALFNFGCEHANSPSNNNYCPSPVKVPDGGGEIYRYPKSIHYHQKLSYDGTKLAFKAGQFVIKVLNLETGEIQKFDIRQKMPSNMELIGVDYPQWCPYDNNRILIFAVTGTDTVGDSKRYNYGQNLFIFSLDGKEFKRVTPSIFGKAGAVGNLNLVAWLPNSNADKDMILLSYGYKGKGYSQIYIPQEDIFIDHNFDALLDISRDGNYFFSRRYIQNTKITTIYSINNNDIHFIDSFSFSNNYFPSFSPDNKYLALSVEPLSDHGKPDSIRRFSEIWIINVEKFLAERPDTVPVKIINLREKFCKYALMGLWSEFVSNNTLAVSMFNDGDDYAYLWEITIDGKIVRQLTFEP